MRSLAVLLIALCSGAAPAAQPSLLRSLPSSARPGQTIAVALAVEIPPGTEGAVVVEEVPPRGWRVERVSPPAQGDGDSLTWDLSAADDSPRLLSYLVTLPPHASGVGVFSGELRVAAQRVACSDGAEIVPVGASINVAGFSIDTWEIIGIVGALVFASRFLVQWIASERLGRSVVPTIFWWISILGTVILTAYGLHFRRLAVVLGQGFGFVVYIRNLMLIARHRRTQGDGAAPVA